jgi:hypothetical protein
VEGPCWEPNSNKRQKVEALLKAAREAAREANRLEGFTGFGERRIRLDVVVHAGSDEDEEPWDATNYLGEIADVLEGKAKKLLAQPGLLDWLGDLINVGLYNDDRQIKEINYREVQSDRERYIVTLSALDE